MRLDDPVVVSRGDPAGAVLEHDAAGRRVVEVGGLDLVEPLLLQQPPDRGQASLHVFGGHPGDLLGAIGNSAATPQG